MQVAHLRLVRVIRSILITRIAEFRVLIGLEVVLAERSTHLSSLMHLSHTL